MKVSSAMIILSLFALSSATHSSRERAASSHLQQLIEKLQLDPLRIASYSLFLADIQIAQNVNVTLTNIVGRGLSRFKVGNLTVSSADKTISFDVVFPQIVITGNHATNGTANGSPFRGSGTFQIVVKNARIHPTIKVTLSPSLQVTFTNSIFTIDSAATNFAGFGSMDSYVNSNLSSGAPAWIRDNQAFVNSEAQKVVAGYINNFLFGGK